MPNNREPHNEATNDTREFWNRWNATWREGSRQDWNADETSRRAYDVILQWIPSLGLADARILEVGCGAGWLCDRLRAFGTVTGVDIADEVIARAQSRFPGVHFIAADFYTHELPRSHFDLLLSDETLACVPDQPPFAARMADVLKPGGYLIVATQNRFVFERRDDLNEKAFAPIRRWLSRRELTTLLTPWFDVVRLTTVAPAGHLGILRIINSHKLNGLVTLFISPDRLRRIKERLGFGQVFVLLARKRSNLDRAAA